MINWVEWLLKGGRFAAKHQFKYDRGPIAKHQTRPCETPNQIVKHQTGNHSVNRAVPIDIDWWPWLSTTGL